MLAMAARGERSGLTALIDSCRDDPAALQFLAGIWLNTDPAAFLRSATASRAMKGAALSKNYTILTEFVRRWADIDFDGSWRATEKLNSICRRALLHELAGKRMDADPRLGLEFALNHPNSPPASAKRKRPTEWNCCPSFKNCRTVPIRCECCGKRQRTCPFAKRCPLWQMADWRRKFLSRVIEAGMDKSLDDVIAWHAQANGNARVTAANLIGDRLRTRGSRRRRPVGESKSFR